MEGQAGVFGEDIGAPSAGWVGTSNYMPSSARSSGRCSRTQAAASVSSLPTLIAMEGPVDDRAAQAFAEGFYDGLGAGLDFAAAHREGCRRALHAAPAGPFSAVLRQRDG